MGRGLNPHTGRPFADPARLTADQIGVGEGTGRGNDGRWAAGTSIILQPQPVAHPAVIFCLEEGIFQAVQIVTTSVKREREREQKKEQKRKQTS